ncbi:tail fiber protein proximal subunit [Pectobacterium bacteriophage PM2]|uniref:Long tail fiber proximal subunit n=1 Tax=Pectobacterium bacteriophage PM2 TaxID=1429794 RepID=A0A0A0Q3M7_9CAUD|nr:tail fiber protein proximal subunit [Pectobacterium bacteriophage PM2]AHY25232.1 long tail fiber proximal subunit [Pectobacterium bacteriophage PM2]
MADLLKPAFRATSGLDAAGEKVINVAKADFDVLSDGVNVDFFIEENTIQQYDPTRGYKEDFAVIYDNRMWISNSEIIKPSGPFASILWRAVRTDPKWIEVTQPVYSLKSGDYVTINSNQRSSDLSLPSDPQDGDYIVVKDIGNNAGYNRQRIIATAQSIIRWGSARSEVLLSKPLSYNIMVFSNRQWQFYETAQEDRGTVITSSSGVFRAQAGDNILRRYTNAEPVRLTLPKYANQGDIIRSVDIDGLGPTYHLIISTFDTTSSIGTVGTHEIEFRTSSDGFLVYDELNKLWVVWDADIKTRLRIIKDDVVLRPNESIMVFGENNAISQTINITLPTSVAIGDTVKIALNYIRKMQTVIIKASPGDEIATDINLLQFPKRSEYPPDAEWVYVTELSFNGDISYTPVVEFSYIENDGKSCWVVAQNVPTIEQVDPKDNNTRKRLGVISLASQAEANVDFENSPLRQQAITPETLANRTATETRRGIARIANTGQVNQDTTFNFQDDIIITPKKLNERTATETRRGVAEISTQAETNAGIDDTTIITPKKLEARRATENMAGIAPLVSTVNTTMAPSRGNPGTNSYDYNEATKIVTPKAMFQAKATNTSQGGVYLALQSEVIAGVTQSGFPNAVVTPETLHAKTSTDSRIGLIEIATQAETDAGTDYTRAVTPKTLNDRKSSEVLTGIARIATQVEFDAGSLDTVISTPLKVKTHFNNSSRTSVVSDSGLVETGTLWDHYTLNIQEASITQRGTLKLSTQAQVDSGTDDTTAITPLKLQRKKSTESTEGIIQLSTQAEVIAGTVSNKAFSPLHYKYIVQQEKSWEATPSRRGYVKLTENALTWAGDNVNGSVANQETFEKTGYAVSPYEMNKALSHYLPIGAKAVDSDKLDGLDSLQFIRRDINQTVDGSLTLTKSTQFQAAITSTSTAVFSGSVTGAGLVSTNGSLSINNGTNTWGITAANNGTTLVLGNSLTLNSNGNASVTGNISSNASIEAKNSYILNGKTIASTITRTPNTLILGDNTQNTVIKTLDASNLVVSDVADYKVLTEKNAKDIVGTNFVKKEGDTMGGKLTVNAPVLPKISETLAMAPLTSANIGFWGAEIVSASIYNTLPGYAVPVMEMSGGQQTGFVDHYEYVKAPGLMTCSGTSIDYIYRTWSPRPQIAQDNHNANTQYISIWDAARGVWGSWGRVYTNSAPPTASEIGAVTNSGSAFDNLTIRDWLQIGNVRIEPDESTQTVKFTWVE